MTSDISRNVVAILLILTIAVSAVGTYAVANAQDSFQAEEPRGAQVNLDIEQRPPVSEVRLVIDQQQTEDNI